jgi:hypothetical protein
MLAGGSWPLRVIASQRVRAKRGPMTGSANPGSLRGGILDCFVARAPRNDEQMAETSLLQFTFQIADAGSPSRGAWRPSFAQGAPSKKTRAQGRPGAGWHPRSVRDRNAHGVDHRCCRSPGLPCADGFNGVLRALLGERCTIAPVVLRMADARARSGRRITASLDARTPGVRTTRLLRPRTIPPNTRRLACARPQASTRPL